LIGDWVDKVDYPQLPPMTEEELVDFFDSTTFARLGTLNEDGSIHIAPVFFKYEDGEFLMATQDPSRKIRNIKRNNQVSILIDTTEVPFLGALIYGTARLDYEDVISKRVKIFERRLSSQEGETYARRIADKWACVIVHVKPQRIVSFDYSKG